MRLQEAILNTDQGEIMIRDDSWTTTIFEIDDVRITMRIPDDRQLLRYPNVLTTFQVGKIFTTPEAEALLKLTTFTTLVGLQIDNFLEERISQLLREQEEKSSQLLKEQEERERLVAQRTEICMNELMGDRVRIRSRGYKGSPRAKVVPRAVREFDGESGTYVETGDYQPTFEFDNEDVDGGRPRSIDCIRKLEVKRGKKYEVVWDDGEDDLPLYQRVEAREMML